jgi:hypothetical protein
MNFIFTALLVCVSSIVYAGNPHIENQQANLEKQTERFKTEYNCPMKFTLDEKKFNFANSLEGEKFSEVMYGIEYEVRMKCKSENKPKFNGINFISGSSAMKYDGCSEENKKDSAKVSLNGKTLTVTCKYSNCFCATDSATEQTKEILKK